MALRDKFFLSGFGWNDLLTLSLVSNSLTVGASNKAIFQFNVTPSVPNSHEMVALTLIKVRFAGS